MVELSDIKNKLKRQELFGKLKHEKNKERHKLRKQREKEELDNPELRAKRLKENVPNTIDNMRVKDDSIDWEKKNIIINDSEILKPKKEENDEENVSAEEEGDNEEGDENSKKEEAHEQIDELMKALKSGMDPTKPPKIVLTTNLNAKKLAYEFANTLIEIFPDVKFVKRQYGFTVKDMCKFCNNRNYDFLMIINEDKKKITGLTVIKLPIGPSFYFKISSYVNSKQIVGHGNPTSHVPELILNNFQTKLGNTVGTLFQTLFPQNPDIIGRQVITLHNQRDYIFFRRHRYVFRNEEKVGLQELGPQFTMKLRRLQKGLKEEVEWEHKREMDKEKKKFYL
ncbi:Ribosome production factor 1 [Hanseniaspora valbyensis]